MGGREFLGLSVLIWKMEILRSEKQRVILETDLDNTCKNFENKKE